MFCVFLGYPFLYNMNDGGDDDDHDDDIVVVVVIIICNNNIAVLLHSFIHVFIVLWSIYVNKDWNWKVIDIA